MLAIGVHPDDVELSAGGTVAAHISMGYKVGILDLTRGELGTRGTADLRLEESKHAAKILGVSIRANLGFKDGFFQNDNEHKIEIAKFLRKYKPEILLCNAVRDRHPDHGRAAALCQDSWFISGLSKVKTNDEDGRIQAPWRPKVVYNYIQDYLIEPDIIFDISTSIDKKMDALLAFKSQFWDPNSVEPSSAISSQDFLDQIKGRARAFGRQIGVEFGEGFTMARTPGSKDLFDVL